MYFIQCVQVTHTPHVIQHITSNLTIHEIVGVHWKCYKQHDNT
ncbi:hypothetical protein Scep_021079 [Stephania cephalantha]|uniref:Uncharacterized protein n=1 Tax=Stephania cephalantha TaxID=152367 RepID=A0AAP0I191_9MAGN